MHRSEHLIQDDREGFIVCTACGLALDQVFHFDADIPHPTSEVEIKATEGQTIRDMCVNFHISDEIIDKCISIYNEVYKKLARSRRFSKLQIMAYSIYSCLQNENVPRSPQEIYLMTGVELAKLYEIEKNLQSFSENVGSAEEYIERFGRYCDLSYPEIHRLRLRCHTASEICENFTAPSIAAALIAIYKKPIKTQVICNYCLVSSSSVYKIMRKLSNAKFII